MTKPFEQAISDANAAFGEAFGRGDIPALREVFYAPGALVDGGAMLPVTTDSAKIDAFFQSMRDQGFISAKLESKEVVDHGAWVVENGVATLTGASAEQTAAIRYTVIWTATAGAWRAQADFFAPLND